MKRLLLLLMLPILACEDYATVDHTHTTTSIRSSTTSMNTSTSSKEIPPILRWLCGLNNRPCE